MLRRAYGLGSPRNLLLIFTLVTLLTYFLFHLHKSPTWFTGLYFSRACPHATRATFPNETIPVEVEIHPIDTLLENADHQFSALLAHEVHGIDGATYAYRERRRRNPPPGFDGWVRWAQEHNVLLIEELFDQIYTDLQPFWAIPPQELRDAIKGWEYVLHVRAGRLTVKKDKRYRMELWHNMLAQIQAYLPDVDLAFNVMDESRVFVPWDDITSYVNQSAEQRQRSASIPLDKADHLPKVIWNSNTDFWSVVRDACPPSSPARGLAPASDFASPLTFPHEWPRESYNGYVANWTQAKDPCSHPHIRGLHGTFIEPISINVTTQLFPVFGGSKLFMSNDILIPPARYWEKDENFSGGDEKCTSWYGKEDAIMWRGVASGGRHKSDTWTHYQRHRFLSMLNSTHVAAAVENQSLPSGSHTETTSMQPIIPIPESSRHYSMAAIDKSMLASWVASFTHDVGFTEMLCFPRDNVKRPPCPYMDPYFSLQGYLPMSHMFRYKYLPDIDGHSFSGRFRAFLRSHSLPIKATIYNEWHDSRLIAWKHFVPMDNTFVDFYGIMDYFLGFDADGFGAQGTRRRSKRDAAAMKIALDGRDWAEKVLRKEDMLAYFYRLVLEYARLTDDHRHR